MVTTPLPAELARLVADVRAAREVHEYVVVSVHWGVAGDALADYQMTVGRAAISAGADLVLGRVAALSAVRGTELTVAGGVATLP